MTRASLLIGLAALCGVSSAAVAASGPSYTVTDLGTLGGGQSLADGINDNGQVVGTSNLTGDALAHAFLFTYDPTHPPASLPAVSPSDLGTLGGVTGNSNGRAINAAGQAVGYSDTAAGGSHAFLSTPGSGMADLGTLGGVVSVGFGVAGAAPLIVGGAYTGAVDMAHNPIAHAFAANGGTAAMQDLGVLGGFDDSAANGVSPGGKIVGSCYDYNSTLSQATLFTVGGTPFGLGTLPGGSFSDAYAASDTLAVGDSNSGNGTSSLFPVTFDLTNTANNPTSLGLLPGYANGVAYGVNVGGSVVGTGYNTPIPVSATGAAEHGFLYTPGTPSVPGTLYDLNGLITSSATNTVLEAFAVNAYGQIVGDGINSQGAVHAFLLSPTPTVTGLSQNAVAPNTANFPLTVTGTNFAPDAVVYFNGVPEATKFVSSTQVTTTIPNVGAGPSDTIDVGTPTPGGHGQTLSVGATLTVSGTVTLQGWLGTGEPTPALTFVLTPTGGGAAVVQTLTPTPTAAPPCSTFTYTLTGVAPGAYTLGVKGPLWLREDVPNGVNTTGGSASGANVTLPPGDINGDNVLDSNDTALLRLYFNGVSGRAGFNPNADLNGDGVVDSNDTALLRAHFNAHGAAF